MTTEAAPQPSVVVVGAGYFAQFHLQAWRRLADEGMVRLVALVEPDDARRAQARQAFAIPDTFADIDQCLRAMSPDWLDIATPPATHLGLVSRAASSGIDCIVQKPLAPDREQAIELTGLAQEAGIRLVVHENFRWMPWYREMKRCLDEGLLGTPHAISVRMRPGDGQGAQAYLSRQPYFQQMPRFLVHETAIHFIDSFRFLLGEVTAVTARLRRLNPVIAGEDAGYIVLEFRSGATALIDANRLNEHPAKDMRLTMGEHWLEGSAGVLRLSGDGAMHFKPHGEAEQVREYSWHNRGFGGDCVYAFQRHVLERVAAASAPDNLAQAYLRNLDIEEAIYQSHLTGRTVAV